MQNKKKFGFTKIILLLTMTAFFITLGVSTYIVLFKDSSQLYSLLAYVGTPFGVCLGFSINKFQKENCKGGVVYDMAMAALNNGEGVG